ncbi:hypothetical protein [Clostridium botulinum]|uniref:hypothetical protein n=1 Tax=Clostridium botulinum TaxID=1491 RepID=UPI000585FC94|nr:hypothetical protein [Clostridium botulinum]AJE13211.1 putative sensor histidine kinase [Clostridium botulinum CDC_1436]
MNKKKIAKLIVFALLIATVNNARINKNKIAPKIVNKTTQTCFVKSMNKLDEWLILFNEKKDYTIKYCKYGFNSKYIPEAQKNPANKFKEEIQWINGHKVTVYKGDFSANPFGDQYPMLGGKKLNFLDGNTSREVIVPNEPYSSDSHDKNNAWNKKALIKNAIVLRTQGYSYTLIDYKKPYYIKDLFNNFPVLVAKIVYADENGLKIDNDQYFKSSECSIHDFSSIIGEDGTSPCISFPIENLPKNLLVAIKKAPGNSYDIFTYCIIN